MDPIMESDPMAPTSLFKVYLRLRPANPAGAPPQDALYPDLSSSKRYLTVEPPNSAADAPHPTHITITPPHDSRRRAVEKFAFTRVFEEEASQLDVFNGASVLPLIEGVLGVGGKSERDGLLATLGVTGSGKTHTILGSRTQRGLTQLSLDVLFRSLEGRVVGSAVDFSTIASLTASDASEAYITSAADFLESMYGDAYAESSSLRAPTPMSVGSTAPSNTPSVSMYPSLLGLNTGNSPRAKDHVTWSNSLVNASSIYKNFAKLALASSKDVTATPTRSRHLRLPLPSTMPQTPDVSDKRLEVAGDLEYAMLISMYEVYNDRIFDLLSSQSPAAFSSYRSGAQKESRRRPLLFKSTEQSPDRKVVAGLRKVVCGTLDEALMVLETALTERRVAGTGSNSVSSRSHGFFCVEVKKRSKSYYDDWSGRTLTIVDLAGSERARNAKTAGATLAEAGKINESLMYLGQCLQMQSDNSENHKPNLVPFRQCKLTELLFSNSFPSSTSATHQHSGQHRSPQKAVMIVNADPLGDFNATSQILRYSALAREITVPRVPSISSTIFSGTTARSQLASGRTSPASVGAEELDWALQEIARLSEETEVLGFRLEEEEKRRREAEEAWQAAEERCLHVEQETRVECAAEMEKKLETEAHRLRSALGEEADRNDEHMDQKIAILNQTKKIHEDSPPSPSQRVDELERENESLRHKVELLERELQGRSPSKKARNQGSVIIMGERQLNAEKSSPSKKAGRTTRATTRSSANQAFEKSMQALADLSIHNHSHEGCEASVTEEGDSTVVPMTTPSKSRTKAAATPVAVKDSFVRSSLDSISMDESTLRPAASPATKTPRTTGRKMRKLTTRKWDLGDEALASP